MADLYENLLKATNNIDDITTEKYATVTKLNGNYCDAKEEDTGLEHTNVPIINGANLSVGDKAVIGFLNNSIYDVVCYGALDKTVHDDSKQDTLISGYVSATKVTSWQSTPSDSNVPSEKLVKDSLDDIEDLIGAAITYINQ